MATHDTTTGSDIPQAEDPSDFNQRRRLKEIADAQREAREILRAAEAGVAPLGETPAVDAFASVRAFAHQIQWPLVSHGEPKYFKKLLGEWQIDPPDELAELTNPRFYNDIQRKGKRITGVVGDSAAEPERYKVAGLFPLPDSDEPAVPGAVPFTALPARASGEWTLGVEVRHEGPQQLTFTNDDPVPVPLPISNKAFEMCNQFLDETGLDVRVDEGRPFNNYSE